MLMRLTPFLCLLHMMAISWWSLPRHFEIIRYDQAYDGTPLFIWEEPILNAVSLNHVQSLRQGLERYIDITGNQQYWDFFAPASPKIHQYFSICADIVKRPELDRIICVSPPLLTNLNLDFTGFRLLFKPEASRWYRLTENLTSLNNPDLLRAFTEYYGRQNNVTQPKPASLILHQFELAPALKGLPAGGYQMNTILWPEP